MLHSLRLVTLVRSCLSACGDCPRSSAPDAVDHDDHGGAVTVAEPIGGHTNWWNVLVQPFFLREPRMKGSAPPAAEPRRS